VKYGLGPSPCWLGARPPQYRSRGEAFVGRTLNRYGIPFVYEQPRLVYDRGRYRVWHPDFSLPDHGGAVVEYAGMPDVIDYMQGIRHKEQVFEANGIHAVFLYPSDLYQPEASCRVMEKIRRLYGSR